MPGLYDGRLDDPADPELGDVDREADAAYDFDRLRMLDWYDDADDLDLIGDEEDAAA